MSGLHNSTSSYSKKRLCDEAPFLVGLTLVLLLCLAQLILGSGLQVEPHDQLDGEVLTYLLHARHLGEDMIPELLGGMPASSLVLASPGTLLFYLLLPPVYAFIANWCLVALASYVGLWLCLGDVGVSDPVRMLFSLLYACLPFYSVYGLSAMGVPLVLHAVRLCLRGEGRPSLALAAFYGAFSSPFLCGFGVVGFLVLTCVVLALRGDRTSSLRLLSLVAVLVTVYLALNWRTLYGLGSVASHREEFVLTSQTYSARDVLQLIMDGSNVAGGRQFYHVESNQHYISRISLIVALISASTLFWSRSMTHGIEGLRKEELRLLVCMAATLGMVTLIMLFYAAFHSPGVVVLRENLPGSLRSFQADRLYWLCPALWYLCGGSASELLLRLASKRGRWWLRLAAAFAVALVSLRTFQVDSAGSAALANARSLVSNTGRGGVLTWESFYAEETFDAIRRDIGTGLEAGRVGSIGLHPSVAAYNGLMCVDGYLSSYPLSYKHEFRDVIAGELELDEGLRLYFDDWGSRCYLFTHEVGKNSLVPRDSTLQIEDLRLDLGRFREIGGRYLLSAVPIEACEHYGLTEVGSYCVGESYYDIHVYEVTP